MLNQEKIRWMSRASIYEKEEGKEDLKRNEYFFGDYVRTHLLTNFVCVSIAYILILGIYILYKIEDVFALIANLQIMTLLREILLVYVMLLIIYTGLGIIYYSWQYHSSRRRVKKYYRILRHIDKCGEQNGQIREEKK